MLDLNDYVLGDPAIESRECLTTIEAGLLAIESGEMAVDMAVDEEQLNKMLLAARFIREAADPVESAPINYLADAIEKVLAEVQSKSLALTSGSISTLLRAVSRLDDLFENGANITNSDNSDLQRDLFALGPQPEATSTGASSSALKRDPRLRMLLVEDDFTSRLLLQTFLNRYGECHIAVNGREAVEAFRSALERGQRYHLICMDIMMPEMDGREAVRKIRTMEEAKNIAMIAGARIFMTTSVSAIREVSRCFGELCDAYLTKPLDLQNLLTQMKSFGLVN